MGPSKRNALKNSPKINNPANKCIHELFEEQVIKTPEATALVFENSELTYQELNEHANRLAHYLCSKGVEKETLVPICTVRSLEMIIGILGILKAGGAYVPIEPGYPLERIAYILEDTRASSVVCTKESRVQLKAFQNVDFIELTDKSSFLKSQPAANLNADITSNNLAYIIYTSGSTGKPKGVMIEHRSLVNYLSDIKTRYINDPIKKAGSFIHMSYSFDASLTGMFMPLLSGKYVVIGSNNLVDVFTDRNLEKYAPYDFIKITPSHLALLPTTFKNTDASWLTDKLVIGGEALRLNQLDPLIKAGIQVEIINEYGPTEATVGCSTYSFYTLGVHKFKQNEVPIGKPIASTHIYILSAGNVLSPNGAQGEIYIGGAGLARGYLNRPELTAEKFIKNPFNSDAGARLYKTGDLGRWLPDRNIEYQGRIDDQVKINGYRIEIGEIESILNDSELVSQGVVLAKADKQGNKRLVGYVVAQGIFDKQAIQSYLSTKLPDYMVPVLWVELKGMPLTLNGKIDRNALPAQKLVNVSAEYVAPGDETELALAEIWQKLFGMERIGVHDDFFELGGNSIHALMLLVKIKRKFHKNFPLAIIFRARTIHQLTAELKAATEDLSMYSSLVPIQPYGTKTPLFAAHAGFGDVVFYQNLSNHLGSNQPFYGLQAKGVNGIEAPSPQMELMAAYYVSLIRKVQPEGPYYLAGYCLGSRIIFEMAQQLTSQGQKVALLANFNGISPTYQTNTDAIDKKANVIAKGKFAKIPDHLHHLAKLSFKEKVNYIFERVGRQIGFRLMKLFYLLRYKVSALVFNFCLRCKLKAPAQFARIYVGISLHKLQFKYKPKAYQGPMVIFRSPGIFRDPYLGWKGLVNGEIKTFDIPGDHKSRRDIMNEPHVQFLAKKLKPFLDN